MAISKTQTYGRMKNTVCMRCGKDLNNTNRLEQDNHERECKKQMKLPGFDNNPGVKRGVFYCTLCSKVATFCVCRKPVLEKVF